MSFTTIKPPFVHHKRCVRQFEEHDSCFIPCAKGTGSVSLEQLTPKMTEAHKRVLPFFAGTPPEGVKAPRYIDLHFWGNGDVHHPLCTQRHRSDYQCSAQVWSHCVSRCELPYGHHGVCWESRGGCSGPDWSSETDNTPGDYDIYELIKSIR